ncbi:MAG: patatin-like phospholipase family protein [Bacteroidota bacterium]
MKKIGLALGAGGARGLSQIIILETFEELGITPQIISGSSIGAVIGTAYAAGLTTNEMKDSVREIILRKKQKSKDLFKGFDMVKLLNLVDLTVNSGGLIKGDKFINFFEQKIKKKRFEDLNIPVKIITTEYWNKKEVVFDSGELLPAVKSSYSLPALFTPVQINDGLYLDGGLVNPLPYDILLNECDIVIGIDISAKNSTSVNDAPSSIDTLFSSFQIMQNSIMKEKLRFSAPDILIRTDIKDVRLFEFNKAELIWEQAVTYKDELKYSLDKVLSK